MAKTIIRLTESDLNSLVNSMAMRMIHETVEGIEPEVTLEDVANAIIEEVGDGYDVSPDGNCRIEVYVGDNTVDVDIIYTVYAYAKPGKEYGYYELPDDPEVIQENTPDVEDVEITVNLREKLEDDGTVTRVIQELFDNGKLYVNTDDYDSFMSQSDYFYDED